MVEIESKLQEARMERGFTRPQLAEKAGVSWETIKSYEVKGATPSLPVALKIAHALDKTVDELFNLKYVPEEHITAEVESSEMI